MQLIFKQRMFSWFDSYDIYDEHGNVAYQVKGQLSWGHKLNVYDSYGNYVGTVKERIFTLFPKFEIYKGNTYQGMISRKFSFFKPVYDIDFRNWYVNGNIFEWNYTIMDNRSNLIASIDKRLWNWTDTYALNISNPADALDVLMFVLAIDAEKCSRDNG